MTISAGTYKKTNELKFPKEGGKDPENLFLDRNKLLRLLNIPISFGITPLKLLSFMILKISSKFMLQAE